MPEEHRQLLLKLVRDILQKYNLDNVLDTINTHLKIEKQNNEQNFEEISIDGFKGLKQRTGKMVIEVLPSIDWNKGKCLSWVLDKYRQGIASGIGDQNDKTGNVAFEPIVLYIGDDVTDEDAFKTVMELKQDSSFGIVVNENTGTGLPRETNAKYILPSTIQVESFSKPTTSCLLNRHSFCSCFCFNVILVLEELGCIILLQGPSPYMV